MGGRVTLFVLEVRAIVTVLDRMDSVCGVRCVNMWHVGSVWVSECDVHM